MAHFDPQRKSQLWVDAGPTGTAAYIIQLDHNNVPYLVSCASRSFSKSESNYSQVEKEAFAALWGCEHYHIYLYGNEFDLYTDNRAVSIILDTDSESRRKTPVRLQLWRSRLTQYDFKTKLIKSEENIADYLSRCLKINKVKLQSSITREYLNQSIIANTEETINRIIDTSSDTWDLSLARLIEHSEHDPTKEKLKQCVKPGNRIPMTAGFVRNGNNCNRFQFTHTNW